MSNDKDTPKFQVYKYENMGGSGSPYLDMSDAYANNIGTVLSFEYEPTKKVVYFKAFITALNESFNTSYKTETVFGRVDPIHTFGNIQRNISFTFKIPAASSGEAFENLGNVQQLAQFMYPTYEEGYSTQANRISEPPLVRLKVMNIVQKSFNWPSAPSATASFDDYISTPVYAGNNQEVHSYASLLGTLNSISVDHNLGGTEGVIEKDQNVVLPKLITVTCDFTAIHEEDLGWESGGVEDMSVANIVRDAAASDPGMFSQQDFAASFANEAFPYGAVLAETQVAPAASSTENAAETQDRDGLPGTDQFLAEEEARMNATIVMPETVIIATPPASPSSWAGRLGAGWQADGKVAPLHRGYKFPD